MLYAINEWTKEHIVFKNTGELPDGRWRFVEADDDGWIKWNNDKECPLPNDCLYEVKLRYGQILRRRNTSSADLWLWMADVYSDNVVVAYRPLFINEEDSAMVKLQIGDYVRHEDLTIDEYMTFANQANDAGFKLTIINPQCRYYNWDYTVLLASGQLGGKDSEYIKQINRNVTYQFTTNKMKEWSDEGLPPVGVVCEYFDAIYRKWVLACIVAHHCNGKKAIWCGSWDSGELFYGSPQDFRPLRTAREEWIDQAGCVALQYGDALGNLYDAMARGDLFLPTRNEEI